MFYRSASASQFQLVLCATPDDLLDVSQLTAATRLRELDVLHPSPPSLKQLSSSSSLTRLVLKTMDFWDLADTDRMGMVEAACALTSLRHLVVGEVSSVPSSISRLQRLSCLEFDVHPRDNLHMARPIPWGVLRHLPPDLGTSLPRLVRLVAKGCALETVPTSLSHLTHLDLSSSMGRQLHLPSALSRLRELLIRRSSYRGATGFSSLLGLEVLDVSGTRVLHSSLAALRPLTHLRHLAFDGMQQLVGGHTWNPSNYIIIGSLRQVTTLSITGHTAARWRELASVLPPPALRELTIDGDAAAGALAALGPWLGAATALTKLSVTGSAWQDRAQALDAQVALHLPTQLLELDLRDIRWRDGCLPSGLLRLSALTVLHVPVMRGVPIWLTALCCLEELTLQGSHNMSRLWVLDAKTVKEVQLCASMPSLRALWLPGYHFTPLFSFVKGVEALGSAARLVKLSHSKQLGDVV